MPIIDNIVIHCSLSSLSLSRLSFHPFSLDPIPLFRWHHCCLYVYPLSARILPAQRAPSRIRPMNE